jgi:drug/metabolite transporter (DMT)-like permease
VSDPGPAAATGGTSARTAMLALLTLLVASMVWGSSFPVTKPLLEHLSAVQFLLLRLGIGTIAGAVVFFPQLRRVSAGTVRRGMLIGLIYGGAQILQFLGLQKADANLLGFVVGSYVVFTPLIAAGLFRQRIGGRSWVAVALSAAGLVVLAVSTGAGAGLAGELLAIASAVCWGFQVLLLSRWSQPGEAGALTVVTMATITAVAAIAVFALPPHRMAWPVSAGQWWALVYLALITGTAAMFAQAWGQAHVAATRAAVVMSSEPVWSAALAAVLLGEPITVHLVIGGALLLIGTLVVITGRSEKRPAEPVVIASSP